MGHPEALIFVALALAWAVYLIPRAIEHHHRASVARNVDRFSHSLRVLARREAVSRRKAELVVPGARGSSGEAARRDGDVAADPTPGASPAEIRARREAARVAARRRRRVFLVLLVGIATTAGVAAFATIAWAWVAVPVGLMVAWLVACRVMVRSEHAAWDLLVRPTAPEPEAAADDADSGASSDEVDPTATTAVIDAAALADGMREPAMWDPVPVTLPTYVSKPVAERSVRTIDLDSTGVWTSGRTDADAALARRADAADQAARDAQARDGASSASPDAATGS